MPRPFALVAVAPWLALCLASAPARAELKEWTISLMPAYALAYVDSRTANGGGGGVEVGFGITEALTLHANGFVSWHALDGNDRNSGGTMTAFSGMLGLTYSLDVIRLVPTFDLELGVLGVRGDAAFGSGAAAERVVPSSTAFGLGLGFGLDYLITRHVSVGVLVRYHALLTDLDRIPVYLFAGPRVTFRFGG